MSSNESVNGGDFPSAAFAILEWIGEKNCSLLITVAGFMFQRMAALQQVGEKVLSG